MQPSTRSIVRVGDCTFVTEMNRCWFRLLTLLALTFMVGCGDQLKEEPTETDILGTWKVVEITGIVEGWLRNNGINSLPSDAWITFQSDGTFHAHELPIMILEAEGHELKCLLYSGVGSWDIEDNSGMNNLLKWKVQVRTDLPNQSWGYACHKDSFGIFLVDGMDWETATGVTLRKGKTQESDGGDG